MIKKHMYMTCMQIEEKSANAIIYLGEFNEKNTVNFVSMQR